MIFFNYFYRLFHHSLLSQKCTKTAKKYKVTQGTVLYKNDQFDKV